MGIIRNFEELLSFRNNLINFINKSGPTSDEVDANKLAAQLLDFDDWEDAIESLKVDASTETMEFTPQELSFIRASLSQHREAFNLDKKYQISLNNLNYIETDDSFCTSIEGKILGKLFAAKCYGKSKVLPPIVFRDSPNRSSKHPRLDFWEINNGCLSGCVSGDHDFPEGIYLPRTSKIRLISIENLKARTRNTLYELGIQKKRDIELSNDDSSFRIYITAPGGEVIELLTKKSAQDFWSSEHLRYRDSSVHITVVFKREILINNIELSSHLKEIEDGRLVIEEILPCALEGN